MRAIAKASIKTAKDKRQTKIQGQNKRKKIKEKLHVYYFSAKIIKLFDYPKTF